MARWKIPPNLHQEIDGGPICFFHEHSIGSHDGRIPRYSDSHACVRCISSLTEGRLTLDVHRIHRKHRRRFLEFWSFVEISDPDDCWEWHGGTRMDGTSTYFSLPRYWCQGAQFSASRVATWFSWGDIGRLPIKHICRNTNCCNPLHIRCIGVPHYYHNRKLQLVDLEFKSRRLIEQTQLFLETTLERVPSSFEKLEKINADWLHARLDASGPISAERMAAAFAPDTDDQDDDTLLRILD